MSRPHYHPDERYVIVLRGTWYTDEGKEFPADSRRRRSSRATSCGIPRTARTTTARSNEDTWVAISGYGPTKATVIDGGELFGRSR